MAGAVERVRSVPAAQTEEPLKTQSAHFLEAVSYPFEPFTDGAAGRDVVRVMEAIERSLSGGGVRVELE